MMKSHDRNRRVERSRLKPVSELVIISKDADPDAAPGETPGGAPLRIRADWKERPRSKDLIVDTDNKAKKDEIERILKKAGLFLSQDRRKRPKALEFERAVTTDLTGLFSYGKPTTFPGLSYTSKIKVCIFQNHHQTLLFFSCGEGAQAVV